MNVCGLRNSLSCFTFDGIYLVEISTRLDSTAYSMRNPEPMTTLQAVPNLRLLHMLTSLFELVLRRESGLGRSAKLSPRKGFTLAELLVGMSLFIALSAVVVPAVVVQVRGATVSAVVKELDGYANAVNRFYADISRYPSEMNQLIYDPDGGDTDNSNDTPVDDLGFWHSNSGTRNNFPGGRIKRWAGPYLNIGYAPADNLGVPTKMSGTVARDFAMVCTGGGRYLAVAVSGITLSDARSLSLYKDKHSNLGPVAIFDGTNAYANFGTGASETAAGLVRWWDSGALADEEGTLIYLLTPVGPPGCNVP